MSTILITDLNDLAGAPAHAVVYVSLAGDLDTARAQVAEAARQVGRQLAPGAACDSGMCRFCLLPVGERQPMTDELEQAREALRIGGIGGVYDEFASLPDAIMQMQAYIKEREQLLEQARAQAETLRAALEQYADRDKWQKRWDSSYGFQSFDGWQYEWDMPLDVDPGIHARNALAATPDAQEAVELCPLCDQTPEAGHAPDCPELGEADHA